MGLSFKNAHLVLHVMPHMAGSADFLHKGPGSTYFRLCDLCCILFFFNNPLKT